MNILFVSLLRAGDFIMQVPLIRTFSKQGDIHILVNDEFEQLTELYPDFQFHFFPRRKLQSLINDQNTSLFDPFQQVREFATSLNGEKFNTVINLTHNRISAYIMDLIESAQKKGLRFSGNTILPMTNSWQVMFNKTFSENQRSPVHYLTALSKSLDLCTPQLSLAEDRSSKKRVYLQAFTSDEKKNWSLQSWSELHTRLQKARPDLEFYFIASTNEFNQLSKWIDPKWIQVCRLIEARGILQNSAFFITSDTSLAHLAAESRTPMVVLSLGSSDYSKTMPWMHGVWVLSTDVGCSPCRHSENCHQETHQCADILKVSTVLNVVVQALAGRFEMSVAFPERLFRMQMDMNQGLLPTESSLTRRIIGNTTSDTHIL